MQRSGRDDRDETTRPGDRLFWRVAAASVALAIVTLIVSQLASPPELRPPPGALPRMRQPPANMPQLLRSLGVGSLIWYMCIASVPVFFWVARRLPLDRARWVPAVATSLVVVVAMATLTALLQYRVSYHGSPMAPRLSSYLIVGFIAAVLPFVTVAAAAYAVDARIRAHERALDAERLRTQLAESRLEALTAQLQPHFLFNTLQGISTLISRDPVAADEMLADLSDLLREVLRRGDRREVPLCEELRVLQSYLDISRRRFGERLSIDIDVTRPIDDALVPFFILQPLVENALQHGIASHAGPGRIGISARREGHRLALIVTDDGPGTATPDAGRGIGLANTRARLAELYGQEQSFELRRTPLGFEAKITLPYSSAPRTTPPIAS